ncbi:unnamed protein product [Mucor hiemalis]
MLRFAITLSIVALISAQTVLAHFQLLYPASRGFDETKEPTVPCGGFDTVQSKRTLVPLKNAFVEIDSEHTSYTYTVSVLVNNNPAVADFSTKNLTEVASGNRNYPQNACLSLDLSKNPSIVNGANATIQVVFNGGDGSLYQCTDVTFADVAPSFNTSMCVNADGSKAAPAASTSASGSNSPAAPSQSLSKASTYTFTAGLMFAAAFCAMMVAA